MTILSVIRGDTARWKFQRRDMNGDVILTQADELYFTVKKNYNTSDYILQKTISDFIFDNDGTYHLILAAEDTELLKYGDYVFDIEVTTNEYVQTIAKGKFIIAEESTWVSNK